MKILVAQLYENINIKAQKIHKCVYLPNLDKFKYGNLGENWFSSSKDVATKNRN